jgi:hypothetical protein
MTTRKIKKGFREMQEKMNVNQQQNEQAQPHAQQQTNPRPKSSDYIDFEEVK